MALYAIGDLHLSPDSGQAYGGVRPRLGELHGAHRRCFEPADRRRCAGPGGDTSWGIDLNEAEADFRFLDQFPCKSIW